MEMKPCSACRLNKPLDEFGLKRGRPKSACKVCEAAAAARWRLVHPERSKAFGRANMARRRADPAIHPKMLETQRASYRRVGAQSQRDRLIRMKREDFFRWKALKSYIWLTADELRAQWDRQGGRCALTGVVLDEAAELDHRIPRSRGGGDTVENAQWLSAATNQAKRNLLDHEFVALCQAVVDHAALASMDAAA